MLLSSSSLSVVVVVMTTFKPLGCRVIGQFRASVVPNSQMISTSPRLTAAEQVMMLHMVTSQLPGWLQVWREVETSIKPRLTVLQCRRSVRQRAATPRVTGMSSVLGVRPLFLQWRDAGII